jgi:glucose-1-phosphate adenylyltransferase
MELIDLIPIFNLYEEFWKIYTKSDIILPQYVSDTAVIDRAIIGEGAEIYGEVYNSVIGSGVYVGEGAVIKDSILMTGAVIKEGASINKSIIAEGANIGAYSVLGTGEEVPNEMEPSIYSFGLVTVGEKSHIPDNVKIGKNTAISGYTVLADYNNGELKSGQTLIKAGVKL